MEDYGFLQVVFVPRYLVLIGELFVLGDGCQRGDVGVHKWWLLHPAVFERGVVGDKAHLGFLEDESEAAV